MALIYGLVSICPVNGMDGLDEKSSLEMQGRDCGTASFPVDKFDSCR